MPITHAVIIRRGVVLASSLADAQAKRQQLGSGVVVPVSETTVTVGANETDDGYTLDVDPATVDPANPPSTVTVTHRKRTLTADEQAAAVSQSNAGTLRQQALAAMQGNRDYVALASPTAAQTTAQTKALSRQVNVLIRLLLGQLDDTT